MGSWLRLRNFPGLRSVEIQVLLEGFGTHSEAIRVLPEREFRVSLENAQQGFISRVPASLAVSSCGCRIAAASCVSGVASVSSVRRRVLYRRCRFAYRVFRVAWVSRVAGVSLAYRACRVPCVRRACRVSRVPCVRRVPCVSRASLVGRVSRVACASWIPHVPSVSVSAPSGVCVPCGGADALGSAQEARR